MAVTRRIYVAATSQHVGKTTTTLGLVSALRKAGYDAGYCKPVGQKYVDHYGTKVDKDAHLFSSFLGFSLYPELHSPVVLAQGKVASYLDGAEGEDFQDLVLRADHTLQSQHDVVVYEGTGHPGVGSAVDMSNADVAAMLGAGTVLVVEAGIGRTLDQLALNLALFRERNVPILGVIVNKAKPSKLPKIRHYIQQELNRQGIPLLGIIPYEETLARPQILALHKSIESTCWLHPDQLHQTFGEIVSSHSLEQALPDPSKSGLLVVSDRRAAYSIKKLRHLIADQGMDSCPLAGIVIAGQEPSLSRSDLHYLNKHQVPVLISPLDTYEVVLRYGSLEVKMSAKNPWKMSRAVDLFQNNTQLSPLFSHKVAS